MSTESELGSQRLARALAGVFANQKVTGATPAEIWVTLMEPAFRAGFNLPPSDQNTN